MTAGNGVGLSVLVPLGPGETEEGPLLLALRGLPVGSEVLLLGFAVRGEPAGWPAGVGFRSVVLPGGRAWQMNAGVGLARGRWLWFLHADTRFTAGTLAGLVRFVGRDEAALGWFDLVFRDGPGLTRLNAWGANLRSAWLGLPFGDQGLVMPAAVFAGLGGFDEGAAYGEDHLLVWAAHGAGVPVRRVGAQVSTSARKYARRGWGATTWLHVRLTVLQAFGAWRRNRVRRVR